VKLVLHVSDFGWPVPTSQLARLLADLAETAEGAGFDGIGVSDHLWQHPIMGGPERPQLEAYTTLGFLVAHTDAVRLMTVVTGAHFRHPALLAKIVTTLDVLSGGRAWLGIGAGHYPEECRGLGIPFPSTPVRFDLLDDALEVCTRMWTADAGDGGPFHGHHVDAGRLLNLPEPLGRPRPPILVAGDGERHTLRLVARYADACSLRPSAEIPRKLDVLRRHCDAEGTDFDQIERTCAYAFAADDGGPATDELIRQLSWLAGLGIETVIGRVEGEDPRRAVELLGRHVIPAVRDLEPAA
jgi:F420-dependent oxidoreductase-like protein